MDKDIASAITPIIEHDPKRKTDSNGFYKVWNAVSEESRQHVHPHTGILPIIGAGGSCILIKREVFEKMPKPWYRFLYEDDNGKPCQVGEDIAFVGKAKGLGFSCCVDTSIICGHFKPIVW
jgi:hypothetical protein